MSTPTSPAVAPAPYLQRDAQPLLRQALQGYPVVVVTGPRQAGKSTLLRHALPEFAYTSLEDPDVREFARSDPRRFLAQFGAPLIIDEAQRVPEILSYLQTAVDAAGKMGQYVLSGSQQFGLWAGVSQSLAGGAAMIELLALRLAELPAMAGAAHVAGAPGPTLDEVMWQGGYPALQVRDVSPSRYYADYVSTYLERDVRRLSAVHDLGTFQRFMRLCAGRTSQLLNLSALAQDAGIAQPTAAAWVNLLEASYVVRRVYPYYRNFGKRLVKTPKLYFLDTGLAAWLLDIRSPAGLALHHARGALFETLVVAEAFKWRGVRGDGRPVYFWRDNIGNEVDLLLEDDGQITLVEVKSGHTFQPEWLRSLDVVQRHIGMPVRQAVVYGGDIDMPRAQARVMGWRSLVRAG